ncbi:hypothetical protein E4K67_12145 [Desulfosporosinus fructosivorans]|uniref:Uncharacterized protein n=1 Tax=Desulfosporosinus fructosivorans TaxID=2018669 RepID=A0A4Z0R4X5_9FIRM|nr:hypothetical protein [Desulfosporosinus fructosivorans]TGE37499.1 hypothetical protein E4K67_12145 [Desulfosporosinus fructosivorans]
MQKKKKFLSLILAIATVIALGVPALAQSPIITSKGALSSSEIIQLKKNFSSENVPVDTQRMLIEKLNSGQLINSMDSKFTALIPEGALNVSENQPVKKFVFPDGSYIKNSMKVTKKISIIPENRAQLIEAIGNTQEVDTLLATESSANGIVSPMVLPPKTFMGVYMQKESGNVSASFYTNFVEKDAQASYIIKSYTSSVAVTGGTYTKDPIDYTTNQYQDGSTPAQAQLDFTVTLIGGSAMSDYHLVFNVRDYSYWGSLI